MGGKHKGNGKKKKGKKPHTTDIPGKEQFGNRIDQQKLMKLAPQLGACSWRDAAKLYQSLSPDEKRKLLKEEVKE